MAPPPTKKKMGAPLKKGGVSDYTMAQRRRNGMPERIPTDEEVRQAAKRQRERAEEEERRRVHTNEWNRSIASLHDKREETGDCLLEVSWGSLGRSR